MPARRDARVALAGYVAVAALLVAGWYEPLSLGRDEGWLAAVSLAAAHVGLGAGLRTAWALVLPALLCVVAFFADGAEGLAWLILILGAPVAVGVTAAGWGVGGLLKTRAPFGVAAALCVAALPAAWAGKQWSDRVGAPRVDAATQRQLMTDFSYGNLCPASETDARDIRRLRRSAAVLIRELRTKPRQLVRFTYYWADDPPETKTITLRELAEERLDELDDEGCSAGDLRRRIDNAR